MTRKRLLILSCCDRKTPTQRAIPAWDLYDGPVYRTLKAIQRAGQFPADLDIRILSARHGLILPEMLLAPYDHRLTTADRPRMEDYRRRNLAFLLPLVATGTYRSILVCAGKLYREALPPAAIWVPNGTRYTVAEGGIGRKMQFLKNWVLEAPTPRFTQCQLPFYDEEEARAAA